MDDAARTDALLKLERLGGLLPKEQENLNQLRDLGGFPRALGLPGEQVAPLPEQPPPAGPASPPPTATALAHEAPTLGRSLSRTLGRGELGVENALATVAQNPRMLLRLLEGPSGLQEAIRAGIPQALATIASPVIAPGATLGGIAAETAARQFGASEQGAQTANTVGQVGTAAAPMLGGLAARTLAGVAPNVPRAIYKESFSPRALKSYGQLAGGDFPREAGKFVPYAKAATLDDTTLLKRVAAGESGLLDVFRHIVRVGGGGMAGAAVGHPIIGIYAGERLGPAIEQGLQGFAKAALTNPATRGLTRQLLVTRADAPEWGQLATVVVSQLRGQSQP